MHISGELSYLVSFCSSKQRNCCRVQVSTFPLDSLWTVSQPSMDPEDTKARLLAIFVYKLCKYRLLLTKVAIVVSTGTFSSSLVGDYPGNKDHTIGT